MPIVLQDPGLSKGITTAGSALAGALEKRAESRLKDRQQEQQQQQFGTLLDSLIGQGGDLGALAQGLKNSGTSYEMAAPFLQESFKSSQKQEQKDPFAGQSEEQLTDTLVTMGVPMSQAPAFSKMYRSSSTGGRTQFVKYMFDQLRRGEFKTESQGLQDKVSGMGDLQPKPPFEQQQVDGLFAEEEVISPEGMPESEAQAPTPQQEFQLPELAPFEGMTPQEKVKHKQFLMKENNPIIQENNKKVKSLKDESRMINQMQKLNESKKLPSGFGRLNVDLKEGKLHLPAGANAETQLYVKMINDWTTKAKESYGSRVTNFDLQQFMARLPTLANSEEGRRLIQSQMDAVNQINQLHYGSIQQVYDKYGSSGIDSAEADRLARGLVGQKEEEFEQVYEDSLEAQNVYDIKQRMEPGLLLFEKEGIFKTVAPNNKERALQLGWRVR